MTAAIALAVVLVIAVAGASMAMESQRTQTTPPAPRAPRPPSNPFSKPTAPGRTKGRDREPAPPTPPPTDLPSQMEAELKAPDLVKNGVRAQAKVISVVDERTIGPVPRSRLVLRVVPDGDESPFEVTIRHAFQTPDLRAAVKVGSDIPVRFSPDDHRVVLDPGQG